MEYRMAKYFIDQYIIFGVKLLEDNIVELAAVKLNETLEEISCFNQSIESNKSIIDILPKFEKWIKEGKADEKLMYSWERNHRNKIIEEVKAKNYKGKINDLLLDFDSLQHVFKNMKDNKLYTVKDAMKKIGLEYIKEMNLTEEVNNVVKIFIEIYGKWIHPGNPVFPKPDEKIFTGKKYWLEK